MALSCISDLARRVRRSEKYSKSYFIHVFIKFLSFIVCDVFILQAWCAHGRARRLFRTNCAMAHRSTCPNLARLACHCHQWCSNRTRRRVAKRRPISDASPIAADANCSLRSGRNATRCDFSICARNQIICLRPRATPSPPT